MSSKCPHEWHDVVIHQCNRNRSLTHTHHTCPCGASEISDDPGPPDITRLLRESAMEAVREVITDTTKTGDEVAAIVDELMSVAEREGQRLREQRLHQPRP